MRITTIAVIIMHRPGHDPGSCRVTSNALCLLDERCLSDAPAGRTGILNHEELRVGDRDPLGRGGDPHWKPPQPHAELGTGTPADAAQGHCTSNERARVA